MARVFAITTAGTSLRAGATGKAECAFTVSNASRRPLRGRAEVKAIGPAQRGWATIAGDVERDFPVDGTHQFVATIAVPSGTPAGTYSFRLDVVSTANPDEDYAEGPTVSLEVAARAPAKTFPWWIVAAAAVLVLVVAGIVTYLLWRPATTGIEVPYVVGLKLPEAEAALRKANLRVGGPFLRQATTAAEDNVVQEQRPTARSRLDPQGVVELHVGMLIVKGSEVPSVVGLARRDAAARIEAAGLAVGRVSTRQGREPPGTVVEQQPQAAAGRPVPQGSTVDLVVAEPARVRDPAEFDVAGRAVSYRGVKLNGGTNALTVAPGSRFRLTVDWAVQVPRLPDLYCPGCIIQLYVGIDKNRGGFAKCLVSRVFPGGASASGTFDGELTAPQERGVYYLAHAFTYQYSCREDLAGFESEPAVALAVLTVN
jgi:hypothetical protein